MHAEKYMGTGENEAATLPGPPPNYLKKGNFKTDLVRSLLLQVSQSDIVLD